MLKINLEHFFPSRILLSLMVFLSVSEFSFGRSNSNSQVAPVSPKNCQPGLLSNTALMNALDINGASTGAFLRETLCPEKFVGIHGQLILPVYHTLGHEQPWIYTGFDDGNTDVEAGFSFQKGDGSPEKPARWLPYIRLGKHFTYADEMPLRPGSQIEFAADYGDGFIALRVNEVLVLTSFDVNNQRLNLDLNELRLRRVTGLAVSGMDFSSNNYADLSMTGTQWIDTQVVQLDSSDGSPSVLLPFENIPKDLHRGSSGVWAGAVAWPSSRMKFATETKKSHTTTSVDILPITGSLKSIATIPAN